MKEKRGPDYFKGKTVVVNGAASGVGAEVARQLAREGAKLALTDVQQDLLESLRDELKGTAADVEILNIDISKREAVVSGVEQIIQRFGGIDGLINTAGILLTGPFAEFPYEKLEKILDVNLKGIALMNRACVPHLMKKRAGFLVITSSVSFLYGAPIKFLYDCTKAGLYAMSQGLQLELEPWGISVHVVLPFMIKTAMTEDLSNMPPLATTLAQKTGMTSPGMVAHMTLKGVRNHQFLILPGREAKYMWRTYRFSPKVLGWITKKFSGVKGPND